MRDLKPSGREKASRQYGVIPYRVAADGVRVLLVTSRDTGRWVIPKGNPMKGEKPHKAAAIEAFEEAGVVGRVRSRSLGTFSYDKIQSKGVRPCRVKVYPLKVRKLRHEWPEARERVRRWFSPDDAAAAVREPELAEILKSFAFKSSS